MKERTMSYELNSSLLLSKSKADNNQILKILFILLFLNFSLTQVNAFARSFTDVCSVLGAFGLRF